MGTIGFAEDATLDAANQRLRTLQTMEETFSNSFDRDHILNILLEQVHSVLGMDAVAIYLLEPGQSILKCVAVRGFHQERFFYDQQIPLGAGLAGSAALNRESVYISDIAETRLDFSRSPVLLQEGFVSYFGVPLVAKGELKGLLEVFHRESSHLTGERRTFLETLGGWVSIALVHAEMFAGLKHANAQLVQAYNATLEGWARALDLRHREAQGHTQRVMERTAALARMMGVNGERQTHIRRGALLHDFGKMAISDRILLKPGPLTKDEWQIMRLHPVYAHQLLFPIEYLRPALRIPYCHHEKWDGTGYPNGLKAEEIPMEARIFAVVDVWEVLNSDRPYRSAWSEDRARHHVKQQVGRHFDPEVVEVFFHMLAGE